MATQSKRQRSSPSASASTTSSLQKQRRLSIESADESSETWSSLAAEATERITKYQPQQRPHEELLQSSLNAFVTWLPEGGRESVAKDIVDATTDQNLYDIFFKLFTGLVVPMTTRSKQSSAKSRFAKLFELEIEPEDHDPTFEDLLYRRDAHSCAITHQVNTDHWKELECPSNVNHAPVEGVHIIPSSYASWNKSSVLPNDTESAWELLWRCFPRIRQAGFRVEDINSPANGITLRNAVHSEFREFTIALKPTDQNNKYEIKVFELYPTADRIHLPKSGYIQLKKAPGAEDLDLPNPVLLDCHYRMIEIMSASEMTWTIERNVQNWGYIKRDPFNFIRGDGGTDIGWFVRAGMWELFPE